VCKLIPGGRGPCSFQAVYCYFVHSDDGSSMGSYPLDPPALHPHPLGLSLAFGSQGRLSISFSIKAFVRSSFADIEINQR
jgi:hypothetical protein